ncbi:FixH protein [Myroides marinus]|uniref:FixH protein n=1 Tax=Myroides marinus TaxID=703342 RepID=A0A1H6U634_9FLAO|nr:FixH family protein [Myroides marinus]SEI87828.1 FixH protein [Myroides marinus]
MIKFNYITYFIVVIGGFMAFILYFVYKIQTDKTYDHELVLENYYESELKFNKQLNYAANTDLNTVSIDITPDQLIINLNHVTNPINNSGMISFYRPNDKTKDHQISFSPDQKSIEIPLKELALGRWNIHISWDTLEGKKVQQFKINI